MRVFQMIYFSLFSHNSLSLSLSLFLMIPNLILISKRHHLIKINCIKHLETNFLIPKSSLRITFIFKSALSIEVLISCQRFEVLRDLIERFIQFGCFLCK
ncbi:hypothetical protein SSS_03434 [Sarcoptes scabiei]|nr:hypothetical protein SSS_03434 [Sarcoptes scabiei]